MPNQVTTIITSDKAVANNELRLSICLRTNGFSFSVVTPTQELLTFGDANFDFLMPLGEMSKAIKSLFDDQGIPAFECRQVRLIVQSDHFVWVPKHLYDPMRDRQYLQMVSNLPMEIGVFHSYNEQIESYMVFTAPVDIVTAFKLAIPGIDVVCHHSVLANDNIQARSVQHPVVLMHVREGVGDFEAYYNNNLLLSNSYPAADQKELLYHALDVMKTLHLETPDMELCICGEVGREIYGMLQHYFPNVTLYTGNHITFSNPQFQTFPTYRHALLLS